MVYQIFLFLFSVTLVKIQSQQCSNQNQIYSFRDQTCKECDPSCKSCSGLSKFECLSCKQHFFKLNNNNSCSSECQKGMYKDQNSMTCDYCTIFGCSECNKEQQCLECDENFELDTGLCKLKKDICPIEQVYSLINNQCIYLCESNQIYDESSKLCNPIQDCNQIMEQSSTNKFGNKIKIQKMSNNKFLQVSSECSFLIYEEHFEKSFYLKLQQDYVLKKTNQYWSELIYGDIGVCQNLERTIGYNFVSKQIEFNIEGELNAQNTLFYVHPQSNLVFFLNDYQGYTVYNYKSKSINFTKKTLSIESARIINQSKDIFLIIEIDIVEELYYTYILGVNQNLFYKIEIEASNALILNEQDKTFLVEQNAQIKICQLIENYSKVKEVASINKEYKSVVIYVFQEKRLIVIVYQKLYMINIHQYSNEKNQIYLLMQIKDGFQQEMYQINFVLNENNLVNILVLSKNVNIGIITIEDYQVNSNVKELSDYFQISLKIDTQKIPVIIQNENQINYIYDTQNTKQIYLRRILIKSNKIEDLGYFEQNKKPQEFDFQLIDNLKSNQGVGEQNGSRLINYELNNRITYSDIKINLQTLTIGKTQRQQFFEKPIIDSQTKSEKLIEYIYIYSQFLPNNKCNYYLVDTNVNQILFQFTGTCVNLYEFYYFQKRKVLFSKELFSLFNIDTKQRILSFSETENIDYSSTLIHQIYKEDKILFSDLLGKFFAFDLETLQFQQLLNDSSNKLTRFYQISYKPYTMSQYRFQLANINDSIYVEINLLYLQEFSFTSNTLNTYQKIIVLSIKFSQIANIYKNQLIIPDNSVINLYSQNLSLVDSINFQFDLHAGTLSFYFIKNTYMFFHGLNKLYRIDLNTKAVTYIQDLVYQYPDIQFIDDVRQIFIFQTYAINYEKMVLLKKFSNSQDIAQILLQMIYNSILLLFTSSQISYIPNIENKSVIQTSYSSDKQIFSSYISSNIQVAYYYDATKKQIIKHNIIPKSNDIIYSFIEAYTQLYADYYSDIFIYTQSDGSLKVFNPSSSEQQINLIKKFSGISRVQFCFILSLVIIQTSTNEILIYNLYQIICYKQYQNLSISGISLDLSDVSSTIKSSRPLRFQVQCFNDLIYLESPWMKFFTLNGKLHSFQIQTTSSYQNAKTSSPIVDLQNKIIIYPHSTYGQYIQKNDNVIVQNLFSYTAGTTKLYYDYEDNLLVILTGTSKSITTVDCILGSQKSIYYTVSTFLSTSVDYFLPTSDSVIIVDITPSIYLYNYKTNTVFTKTILQSGCQSILYFENNNFLILQTFDLIHIYSYPSLTYIESLIDYNNPSKSNIKQMYLIPQMNVLFVIRQDSQILTYDLIQTLIIQEKNLQEIMKNQYLSFKDDLIVLYSIQDSGLSLFENTVFRDELNLDLTNLSLPNKCDLYKMDDSQFAYISGQFSLVVKINFKTKKFEVVEKLQLQNSHSDTLYDSKNKVIYLIHSNSKSIYKLKINEFQLNLTLLGKLKYEYQQVLLCNQSIVFSSKNMLTSLKLDNIENLKEKVFGQNISFIKKLSNNVNPEINNDIFDYNLENTYDVQNNQFILVVNNSENTLYIFNSEDLNTIASKQINYCVLNIVVDIKRKIFFSISNIYVTFIYDYALNLISAISNPCLLDTSIFFDEKIIYTICPNTVYFYNSFTLEKLEYSITKGYLDIVSIKSIDRPYSYILTQSSTITVIQFTGNNLREIRTIFSRSQQNLYIYDSKIQYDINHSSYLHIKGLSWIDIVEYLIPFEKSQNCLCQLKYVGKEKTSQLIAQIQSNTQSSQQQIKQIQIQLSNGQLFEKITLDKVSQNGVQLILFSEDKTQNSVTLNDGNFADDLSFNQLIIRDIELKLTDSVLINQNKNLKKLLIQNTDILEISNQLIIQDIETIILINISLKDIISKYQDGIDYVILIRNCSKLILENIEVKNLTSERNIILKLENVKEIYVNNLQIHDNKFCKFMRISNSNQLKMQNILIYNLNSSSDSIFEGILIQQAQINQIQINNVKNHQLHHFQGCKLISFEKIQITQVENVKLLETQTYQDSVIYPTKSISIHSLDIQKSINIGLIIQAEQFTLEKSNFVKLSLYDIDLIYSQLTNIMISQCYFTQLTLENDYSIIKLNNFNNISVKNSEFKNSVGNIMYFLNQNKKQQIEFSNINFIDNSHNSSSIIILILSQSILVQNSLFQNNNSQQDGGCIRIEDSQNLTVQKTNFLDNKSNGGKGGAIFISNAQFILFDSLEFYSNESSQSSGGALYIENTHQQQILNISLKSCKFLYNLANLGLGGAIAIVRINLILEQTTIEKNQAAIGGGIHYSKVIPKFIQNKQIEFNGNQLKENKSILYGNNISSILRKIKLKQQLDNENILIIENKDQNADKIIISDFKSGGYLSLTDIQLIDEEENNYKLASVQKFHKDVQDIILQSVLTIDNIDESHQVKFSSDFAVFKSDYFSLNTSISYQPNNTANFIIKTPKLPSLIDSNGTIFIEENELTLQFKTSFRDCMIGEIQKEFLESIVCEECPDGKYSLNKNDQSCSICPNSAISCNVSKIILKRNYWRESENSDNIILCSKAPENCDSQSTESKFGCAEGYIGPLCEQCDIMGDVWGQKYFNQFSQYKCSQCSNNYVFAIIHLILFICFLVFYINLCIQNIISQVEKDMICYYLKKSELLLITNSGIFNIFISQFYFNYQINYNSGRNLNSAVFSKILIDHLQIISIVSSFQLELPQVFQYPSSVGGNPVQIQNSSFDCLYPSTVNDNIPLWFAKMLWSVSLPFTVLIGYYFIILFKKVKNKIKFNVRYYQTAIVFIYLYFYPSFIFLLTKSINCIRIGSHKYAQIDLTLTCRDFKRHFLFNILFSIPCLVLNCLIIPFYLFIKTKSLKNNKISKIQKSHFQFIYDSYKEQFYYWEFFRLMYKAVIMISSILLSESTILRTCTINTIVIAYFFNQMKVNPYSNQFFNFLETQSIIMCILTLNLCIMYQQLSIEYPTISQIISSAIIIINFYFIMKILLLTFLKPISSNKSDRNKLQQLLYVLREKFPKSLSFIQINYKVKFSTIRKINLIKQYIKRLSVFVKQQQNIQLSTLKSTFMKQSVLLEEEQRLTDFVKNTESVKITDFETINSEFDTFQQSQQLQNIQKRYKTKSPLLQRKSNIFKVKSYLTKINLFKLGQGSFFISQCLSDNDLSTPHSPFKLTVLPNQNDYILEKDHKLNQQDI